MAKCYHVLVNYSRYSRNTGSLFNSKCTGYHGDIEICQDNIMNVEFQKMLNEGQNKSVLPGFIDIG